MMPAGRCAIRLIVLGLPLSLLLSFSQPISAAKWRGSASATLDLEFSDNIDLSDTNPRSDTLLVLSPSLNFNLLGSSRVSSSIAYNPRFTQSFENSRDSDVTHFLDANMDAVLKRNWFGVRIDAQAGQRVIDPRGGFGGSINNPDNLTNTYSLRIEPYSFPTRLGRYAYLDTRFGAGLVINEEGTDSGNQSIDISLKNGPYFSRWNWALNYSSANNTNRDTNETDNLGTFNFESNHFINRNWSVSASLGYDDLTAQTLRSVDGVSWVLGVTWTPSDRSNFSLGYTDRFDGNALLFNFFQQYRRFSWQSNFTRTISTANNDFLQQQETVLVDVDGNPIVDTSANQQFIPRTGPQLNETLFIADTFRLAAAWSKNRTSLSVNADYVKRDNLQVNLITKDLGVNASLSRRLSRRSSVALGLNWLTHKESVDPLLDYRQWSMGLSYGRVLGRRSSVGISYRYTSRDTENQDGNYSENRVTMSFSSRF